MGVNYGQGSSRENAAIAPRYLGARVVIAKSFARIHWQNLINFGVIPLTFTDANDYDRLQPGNTIRIANIAAALTAGDEVMATVDGSDDSIMLRHNLSERQIKMLMPAGPSTGTTTANPVALGRTRLNQPLRPHTSNRGRKEDTNDVNPSWQVSATRCSCQSL